jgi:hypothetical protein
MKQNWCLQRGHLTFECLAHLQVVSHKMAGAELIQTVFIHTLQFFYFHLTKFSSIFRWPTLSVWCREAVNFPSPDKPPVDANDGDDNHNDENHNGDAHDDQEYADDEREDVEEEVEGRGDDNYDQNALTPSLPLRCHRARAAGDRASQGEMKYGEDTPLF